MCFSQFSLPPIQDALVIGRKASIGPHAIAKAFDEMTPGVFQLIMVEHPTIEAVLVRKSDLRKIPETHLVSLILRHAGPIMDETDSLHVSISVEVVVEEEVEVQ